MSNSDFKEALKQQADIVRIVGEYVKLRKAGAQNFSGLCPFHGEKTPSFSVHATRQFFHCFGCGVSGDVFTFVQKIENISFPEAVHLIAQKAGVPMPKIEYSSPAEAREARLRGALLEIHEKACAYFQDCVRRPEGAHAREYLASRGLTAENIAAFKIGYAPESGFLLRDHLKGSFDEEILRESGLFSWKESDVRQTPAIASNPLEPAQSPSVPLGMMYSKFRNRVTFPIANESGRLIAFTGRTLSSDEKAGPKYLNSPETPIYSKSRVLFNLDLAKEWIRKFDYAILVEGQMDCISVFAAGFQNVIASSGTAFTELQAKLLQRFSKNVVVNFDPDTAGARATERTLALLTEEDFQIKVLTLETGFDPDLFIRRKGKDAYAAALKSSQKYFDYLIERARQQFPARSADSKVKAVNYLLPHIQRVPSRIVRDELAHEIAQRLGIDSAVLRQELKHVAGARAAASLKAPVEAQITDAERVVIRALASVAADHFHPRRHVQIILEEEPLHVGLGAEALIDALLQTTSPDPFALDLPDSDRRLLASILLKEDDELTEETLNCAMQALRRKGLSRRLKEIEYAISTAASNREQILTLAEERVRIKRALMQPSYDEDRNRQREASRLSDAS